MHSASIQTKELNQPSVAKQEVKNNLAGSELQLTLNQFSIQPKLTVGAPDDEFEKEAESMADTVMRMPENNFVQRKCADCEKEEKEIQRKPITPFIQTKSENGNHTSDQLTSAINTSRGSGSSLDNQTKSFMESRFGNDFSSVNIHTGSDAIQMNRELYAQAFTVGSDIYFNEGKYQPNTDSGKHLLAHELTHVVQQVKSDTAESVQRTPDDDTENIHSASRAAYSDYMGIPIDQVSQYDSGYAAWLRDPGYSAWVQSANELSRNLTGLIAVANWPIIRRRRYPIESAAGIHRAHLRHAGTSPDLTGLGTIASLNHLAAAIRTIQTNWATLATPAARVTEIGNAANAELTTANVPNFLIVDKERMTPKGYFSRSEWKYVINEDQVNASVLNNQDAAQIANTTIHESRHAEQAFLAARFNAGVNNADAAAIVAQQYVPMSIARQAVTDKFDANTSADVRSLGEAMFQSTVTNVLANQTISNAVTIAQHDLDDKRNQAQLALDALNLNRTRATVDGARVKMFALGAAVTELETRYSAYRQIPAEADSHEVGDAEEEAFLGWRTRGTPSPSSTHTPAPAPSTTSP